MEWIDVIGYFGALLIGVVLGLIGGGGSILTVPILVYVMSIEPVKATAYSLFVVGVSALIGAVINAQKGMVDFKTGVIFAIPAFIAVFLTRKWIVPAIPEYLFSIGSFEVTKDVAIMVFFAIVMLFASVSMIRGRKEEKEEKGKVVYNYPLIILEGLVVGILTGIVGAGGGFLIIPALVLFARLPMKKAVATSLMIIAIKSLIGFLGDLQHVTINWTVLLVFTGVSAVGIFLGIYLSKFIDGEKLKKGFGYFVLFMGLYVILAETAF